jgi:hypothetical protein
MEFHCQVAELLPHLEAENGELSFTHHLAAPTARPIRGGVRFFNGRTLLATARPYGERRISRNLSTVRPSLLPLDSAGDSRLLSVREGLLHFYASA